MANRVLVVGWDGADWEILDPLLAAGDLPNLAALAERGARGVARSVAPSHSWAAWPSFLTGVDPAGHGVFDILEHRPGQTRRMPVSSRSILAPTWPQRLSDAGRTVLLLNVPLTYPPIPVRGVVISGGVVPPKAVYSHPPEAGPDLRWPINGGSWTTFRNRPLDLVADVEKVTTARAGAVRRLMDEHPWDVACAVFVSPDRIQHCLLEYVHPGHPDHARAAATPVAERVRDVYRLLDRELGTLVERTDESDTVVVMSDHGHQPCTRALNMNRVLEHLGYLHQGRGSALVSLLAWGRVRSVARVAYDRLGLHGKVAVPTAPIDWARTRAYTSVVSTGEGVSLALRGREPEGTIAPEDYERARSELAAALEGFTDPGTGERPIRRAVPREQVLEGAYLDRAPDLLLEAAPLYSLTHARAMVEQADWLSGDHRPEGVYVAAGPGAGPANGAEISLTDFAALISGAAGVEPDAAWSAAAAEEQPAAVFSDQEQREVEERLRGLGYLE
jgi:predicted AlkP superfamily phosphohydrolase/phosphomutase